MKKTVGKVLAGFCLAAVFFWFPLTAEAKNSDTIKAGVYAGEISLADMTVEEAEAAVEAYVAALEPVEITLLAADGQSVV